MKILNCIFLNKIKIKLRNVFMRSIDAKTDKEYLQNFGKIKLGYTMDLDNPKTLNEKLNWYKLNYKNDLMISCTDKWEVRKYVEKKGLKEILVKNYGVYDKVEDIDLDILPDKFVAKATGDSGGVLICKNKSQFFKQAINKYKDLNNDYSQINKEWQYHHIKNRIIIEELIETNDGHSPKDYKFFCFNGKPKFLYVASERDTNVKFDFFDLDWNHINVKQVYLNSRKIIKKPDKFDEMIKICGKLSQDFPHVRVDLYYEKGRIYFGELTFFHMSGLSKFFPEKYDYIFGEYFDITTCNEE